MGAGPGAGGEGEAARLRRLRAFAATGAGALLTFLLLRGFVVEAFRIPTSSMEGTLLVGDLLLVNKAAYGAEVPGTGWDLPGLRSPEVGDVVVFRPPRSAGRPPGTRYVKRVVGGGGDTLAMRSGRLYRNGEPVREPYARRQGRAGRRARIYDPRFAWQERHLLPSARGADGHRPTGSDWGPLAVPPGSLFVLGDNRADSEDSRHWGFVPERAVTGDPLFVYGSLRRGGSGGRPWHERVRWARIFSAVR